MQIISKNIDEIKPYENNPRKNKKAINAVKASIKEFGFKVPIILDNDSTIIAGHTRYEAAKELDLISIPCILADDLSEEQVRAFRVVDNKTSELSEWDFEKLEIELKEICEIDMSLFGFEIGDEFSQIEAQEDDFKISVPKNPKAKHGDVYELGNHRLMCGDSTEEHDVDKLIGSEVDLVVTDPPYNVDVTGMNDKKILNDNLENDAFREFLQKAFYNVSRKLKKGGCFYVWHGSNERVNFEEALLGNNLIVRQEIIWNKNHFTLGRQDYQWKHEPCLYGWKEGAKHFFCNDRTQSTIFEQQEKSLHKLTKDDLIKIIKEICNIGYETTVIDENKPQRSEEHPTMKPVNLIGRQISNSSKKNWLVFDPFGGSGTTLIACEQLGRRCMMMEKDPKYVDVIIERWEKLTGLKARKC